MFNLGPMEVVVLVIVGIVVIGPEKLPGFAKDAASLIRTLRDLATGARKQLRDELGPEFADVDFRNLNPRTAVQRMVFGEEADLSRYNPRSMMRDAVLGDEDIRSMDPRTVLRDAKSSYKASYFDKEDFVVGDRPAPVDVQKAAPASRPRPRPRPSSSYDGDDIT